MGQHTLYDIKRQQMFGHWPGMLAMVHEMPEKLASAVVLAEWHQLAQEFLRLLNKKTYLI